MLFGRGMSSLVTTQSRVNARLICVNPLPNISQESLASAAIQDPRASLKSILELNFEILLVSDVSQLHPTAEHKAVWHKSYCTCSGCLKDLY